MKNKHIIIDANAVTISNMSGVGHYVLGILKEFDELAACGKISYSLIVPRRRAKRIDALGLKHICAIKTTNGFIRNIISFCTSHNIEIPFDLFFGRGIYYFPAFRAWHTHAPSCVVIHDTVYLDHPETVSPGTLDELIRFMPRYLTNATRVITVSNFSRERISEQFGIPPNRIYIAPPGVDTSNFYRRSSKEIKKVLQKYGLDYKPYILAVGNNEPRKNYGNLIKAYSMLPRNVTQQYSLVIVSAESWKSTETNSAINNARKSGLNIILLNSCITDADMPAIYSGALFLAFMPIYEGFGMPALEAAACGVPILASRVTAVPEAAGPHARYINDPLDISEISTGLYKMCTLSQAERDQITNQLNSYAQQHTWQKTALATLSALLGMSFNNASDFTDHTT